MKRMKIAVVALLCLALLGAVGCGRKNNYADIDTSGKDVTFRLVDLDGQTETNVTYEAGDTVEISVEELYGNVHLAITPYVEPQEEATAEGEEAETEATEEPAAPAPIFETDNPGSVEPFQIAEAGTYTITIVCSKRTSGTIHITVPQPEAEAEEGEAAEGEAAEGEEASEEQESGEGA
ncbi:MAG: hypothetical protein IJH75_04125 [Mogibacterium sp.]|nr:hypothetical protein [Mogibacterium sp.]